MTGHMQSELSEPIGGRKQFNPAEAEAVITAVADIMLNTSLSEKAFDSG